MPLDYILVDLEVVRRLGLIESAIEAGREKINRDGRTSFTWLELDELQSVSAIVDMKMRPTLRQKMRTPAWYEAKCDAWNRAYWRGQITEKEAKEELEFWHQVCWRLPWPEGWGWEE